MHVITQIVNSLLGLVVFPWERHFTDAVEQIPLAHLTEQGWPDWQITRGESKTLGELLRRLRNAAAHNNLEFSSDSPLPEEVTIKIWSRAPVWQAEIRANQLREFCYRFFDLVDQRMG